MALRKLLGEVSPAECRRTLLVLLFEALGGPLSGSETLRAQAPTLQILFHFLEALQPKEE